ncbi:hypothetical protein WJ77_12135 [Burkholderia ubonensis]|uniref:DUF2169 family type VI secretion system accessory protein n=1 Tax=Burkholderia ubonensis TaxID=101571 RepID=UPI000754D424|nr:DUF2169 domain-containing protein [Burkholderia ubonensis]KVO57598.1 hypothetical protein WJ77_12135 [Burkholderia ubonensis]
MEFRNLTPFHALAFSALDTDDREYRVIAMKVAYRVVAVDDRQFVAVVVDDEPYPLCMADQYTGKVGESSVREESDLAPHKPRCDVVVRGNAYAPHGVPAERWPVRIRVSIPASPPEMDVERPLPLSPGMALNESQREEWERIKQEAKQKHAEASRWQPVLDKALAISGPRYFARDILTLWRGWRLTSPEPASNVNVGWERAFGGSSVVKNPDHETGSDAPAYLINEVCFSNPLGCGWMHHGDLESRKRAGQSIPERLSAPQIETVDGIDRLHVARHPAGELTARMMTEVAGKYGAKPAGFGFIGRAWAPRLPLAGTYDDAWLEKRWPYLPKDFDFGYWNGAPVDQQTPYLPPDARIELWNLTSPERTPTGYMQVDLPGHRPFVLLRFENGYMLPFRMVLDTLIVDTDALLLIATYRIRVPVDAPIRVVEARYETDPSAPLVQVPEQETDRDEQEIIRHGG